MDTAVHSLSSLAQMPQHVAIIMDGNGRWAKKRLLPRVVGHARGVEAVRRTVKACLELKIPYLTLFAFSSENWRRPAKEVDFLMDLFLSTIKKEVDKLNRNNIRLRVVGDLSGFSEPLRDAIAWGENLTAHNTALNLTVCANYGGKWDIVQAMQSLMASGMAPEAITPDALAPKLALSYAPDPDLFIRTGGEQRISNFLLWQLAYTELYFTDMFWPDFDREALIKAIASFGTRERRFGRTSEQLEQSC